MNLKLNNQKRPAGFALVLVMVLCAISILILVSEMNRTSTVAIQNFRTAKFAMLNNAAEAATEKVFAKMAWDFQANGPGYVTNQLVAGAYNMVPTSTDNAYWANVQFSNPQSGAANSIYVGFLTNYNGPMPTQYTNQYATVSPVYRITANATMTGTQFPDVVGTAQEDVMLALVPITTYAIFYNGELEFSDCATMLVKGRVHSNADICVGASSGATLTFDGAVTCGTSLSAPARGGISIWTPNTASTWLTTFNAGYSTSNTTVNLAITMTNTHSIIDIPSAGEDAMSSQGQVRLYNQAQVILLVSNSVTAGNPPTVKMILQTGFNGNLPGNDSAKVQQTIFNATPALLATNAPYQMPFLSLTNSFTDQRQSTTTPQLVTQIDVAQYSQWLATNTVATGKFTNGAYPTILYVADRRTSGSAQAVVRLVNGTGLPYNHGLGFTVATLNPLYVKGNYNLTNQASGGTATGLGATTNGASLPAALLSDALTILSPSWQDSQSAGLYTSRNASSMTLNAAIVTGNIPSTGTTATTFSGGVHNLTRFLETWSGDTLTLNTSIVCLFSSQIATAQFQMPGAYYDPPTRNWGFDQTYYSPNKQPPGVPCALVPIRFNWQQPPPGSVTSN